MAITSSSGYSFPNPGIGWTWIIDIMIKALGGLLPLITPTLAKELQDFLVAQYKKALETPNPWDDFLYRLILRILSIPVPGE